MKKKRIVKQKLIDEIVNKKKSRKNIDDFMVRFLLNYSSTYLVYKRSIENLESDEFVSLAISQHITSIVSITETFLRDVFVFLINKDTGFRDRVVNEYGLLVENNSTLIDSIDVMPEFFNFQNICDIEKAFDLLIEDKKCMDIIGNFIMPIYDHSTSEIKKFSMNRSLHNWRGLLEEIIEERHSIVHDANYRTKLTKTTLEKYQVVILYFSQILSYWIISMFNLSSFRMCVGDNIEIPFIVRIEDMDKEWEVVDE